VESVDYDPPTDSFEAVYDPGRIDRRRLFDLIEGHGRRLGRAYRPESIDIE